MLKDDIHKSATLILVGAYGIMLLDVVVAVVSSSESAYNTYNNVS